MESYSNLIKFYCLNVDSEYGNEYSFTVRFLQLKKENPQLKKEEAILEASKK